MNPIRIYDGANFCGDPSCCKACPVIEHYKDKGMVQIHDPDKPENGTTRMTVAEYNALIKNAKPILVEG
jgi:hypothetical protein